MIKELLTAGLLLSVVVSPTRSQSQDTIEQARIKALANLRSGSLVRLISEENGTIGGAFLDQNNDTLWLGFDKRCGSGEKSKRRLLRKGRAYASKPSWRAVEGRTAVSISSIKEIHSQGRATLTGTVVGSAVGGLGGLLLGAMVSKIDESTSGNSAATVGGMALVGVATGALIGTTVGAMLPKWKLRFRDPRYRHKVGSVDGQLNTMIKEEAVACLYPALSMSPGTYYPGQQWRKYLSDESPTVYAGVTIMW